MLNFTYNGTHRPLFLLHICVLWARFSPTFAPVAAYQYQAVSLFAALLAMNSMACRVFRLLREVDVDEEDIPLFQISTIHFDMSPLRDVVVQRHPNEC